MRSVLLSLLLVGCHHDAPAPVVANHPVAAPPTGDRAYVADDTGLVEVTAGAPPRVVVPDGIQWCAADARAHVVWFTTEKGLAAYDLEDGRVHRVIDGELAALEMIIDWGAQKLGGESAVEFDVGLALHMTAKPTLTKVMGCDGDRFVYCYDDQERPTAELAALEKRATELRLADARYVAALAARGESGSLWTPPPMPPEAPKPPVIDTSGCTEVPESCGQLTAVPASPLWLVTTANSRGDYFHQTRELWDPRTGERVRVEGGRLQRTKLVGAEDGGDYAGMRVSAQGVLSIDGIVFDDAHVLYAPKTEGVGKTCGFASGGWRIAGPTDG